MYTFLQWLILHVFNYTIVTYGYFKYTELEPKPFNSAYIGGSNNIQVSLRLQRLTTDKEPLSGLKCFNIHHFWLLMKNAHSGKYVRIWEWLKDSCTPHVIKSTMVSRFCQLELAWPAWLTYAFVMSLSILWNTFFVLSSYNALYRLFLYASLCWVFTNLVIFV